MWERGKMCNACNGEDDDKHEDLYESPREWETGYFGPASYWGRRRRGYWDDEDDDDEYGSLNESPREWETGYAGPASYFLGKRRKR